MKTTFKRRDFALALAAGSGAVVLGALSGCTKPAEPVPAASAPSSGAANPPPANVSPIAAPNPAAVQGKDYKRIKTAVPTDTPKGKAEVLEFFGYWCPHCNHFAPEFEAWRKQAPAELVFSMVPVAFGDPNRQPLQRLYLALRDLNLLDALHMRAFKAVHEEKLPLFTNDAVIAWAKSQKEVNAEQFMQAYNSFSMDAQMAKADQLTQDYEVDGVPSFGVAGKYYVDGTMAKSMARATQIATMLALQEAKA